MKIASEVVEAIERHARDAAPDECCGLLLGTADAITLSARARNLADDPRRRYQVDPRDYFEAIRHARAIELDVVGAYHSHSSSPPVPSETDRAEAFEEFLFLIVGWSKNRLEIRAWRLSSGNFIEVPLVRSI